MNYQPNEYEITTDGKTVWINVADGCIARFGLQGIDIHHPPLEVVNKKSECLFCTHGPTTLEDWRLFTAKVKEFYGIEMKLSHMPTRFHASVS